MRAKTIRPRQREKRAPERPEACLDISNSTENVAGRLFSEYERDIIRARMIRAKKAKLKRGEWASGANSVPYGFELRQEGKRSQLHPKAFEIECVKLLFKFFIDGGGLTSFAELSRETGISYDAVGYILNNEIYTGYHVVRRTADPRHNVYKEDGTIRYQRRKVIPVEERERIKMFDNPPISQTIFAQAQRLLALRREMRVKVREGVSDPYLYRGLLRCAECGRKLITLSYTNRGANNFSAEYYVCQGAHGARTPKGTWRIDPKTGKELASGSCPTRRIRRSVLEPILDDLIASRLADPKFLAKIIEADAKAKEMNSEDRIHALQSEIEEIESSIERNHALHVRGKISEVAFDKTNDKLQLELRAARIALEKARPDLARITPEIWVPLAKRFRDWKRLDQAEKRSILAVISPVFEVAGYAGQRYHETTIKVKRVRLGLGGGKDEGGEITAEIGDDPDASGLVHKLCHI